METFNLRARYHSTRQKHVVGASNSTTENCAREVTGSSKIGSNLPRCLRNAYFDCAHLNQTTACDSILTWTFITIGAVLGGNVASNAGMFLIALQNVVAMVRGTVVAFLDR